MTLRLDGVQKSFGSKLAVTIDELEVPQGSVYGLLGPNGAGKTTTIRLVIGMINPDRGAVSWNGQPIREALHGAIGYLPEERGLYKKMSARDQLIFFARVNGKYGPALEKQIDARLEEFALDPNVRADQLSKGNQQKLQLLVALVHQPALLVLDEPFTALDPVNNELFRRTARELAMEGTTILLSTHDMEEAEDVCSHIAFMHRGAMVFTGTVEALRARFESTSDDRYVVRLSRPLGPRQLSGLAIQPEEVDHNELTFVVKGGSPPVRLLEQLPPRAGVVELRQVRPSLRSIFLTLAGEDESWMH